MAVAGFFGDRSRPRAKPLHLGLSALLYVFFAIFLIWPIVQIVAVGFRNKSGGFTLGYVHLIFKDQVLLRGLLNALLVAVLGYKPGADFKLASYEDALGYFRKLAAASNRIKLVNVGKTTQGRDWFIAFISDPANLAQIDHYKDVSRRLAVGRRRHVPN